uniref:Homeobox domain-containing protein n=1 Tax=Gouania willdenowi TaxID=441366 RepID=A0A8C5DVN7_GOUWI
MPLSLPKLPMLPLSLPQLPLPPLPLPKLTLPPIPFPMELPLLPSVVMQSVALQSQQWLDSSVNPELAKLYQSQLNPALLGQQSPLKSQEEITQNPPLTLSPCTLSPGLPAKNSPLTQTSDPHRAELHRGRRSSRTRFTEQQLDTLQEVFEATPYPREEEYDRLSALLSLPNRVIVVWFQNARQRARKNQDKVTEDGSEGKNHRQSREKDSSAQLDPDPVSALLCLR